MSSPSPLALNFSQHQGLFQRISSASGAQSIRASASASVLPNIAVGIVIMVWLGGQSPTLSLPWTAQVLVLEFWENPQSQGPWRGLISLLRTDLLLDPPRENPQSQGPWRGLISLLRTDLLLDPPTPESQKGNPPLPIW